MANAYAGTKITWSLVHIRYGSNYMNDVDHLFADHVVFLSQVSEFPREVPYLVCRKVYNYYMWILMYITPYCRYDQVHKKLKILTSHLIEKKQICILAVSRQLRSLTLPSDISNNCASLTKFILL